MFYSNTASIHLKSGREIIVGYEDMNAYDNYGGAGMDYLSFSDGQHRPVALIPKAEVEAVIISHNEMPEGHNVGKPVGSNLEEALRTAEESPA